MSEYYETTAEQLVERAKLEAATQRFLARLERERDGQPQDDKEAGDDDRMPRN